MIYKNKEIPNTFNKIAEISDNYIVWVEESNLINNRSYDAYVQFINPSFSYYFTDSYYIKNGTSYELDYNYINGTYTTYLDSANVNYSLNTMLVDDDYISFDETSRADTIPIFIGQIFCCICILWVFKQLSRLFFRGGLS